MTKLEIAANAFATASILLAARNSVHTWWTGIVGCALFALLFGEARLYADVTLQFAFIVASIAGWWWWMRGAAGAPPPIRRAAPGRLLILSGGSVLGAIGYGALLHAYTDAYAPFLDSFVLSLSLLAQFLLVRREIETWAVWLLVNTIAVPLYASRGLYLTAALYAAYWVNAWVGGWAWAREMRRC
jgi:nicotinamide mononucleotide transporter